MFFASYFWEVNYAHLSGDIIRDGSQADMIASSSNLGDIIIVCRYCFPVLEVLKEDIFSGGATETLRPANQQILVDKRFWTGSLLIQKAKAVLTEIRQDILL